MLYHVQINYSSMVEKENENFVADGTELDGVHPGLSAVMDEPNAEEVTIYGEEGVIHVAEIRSRAPSDMTGEVRSLYRERLRNDLTRWGGPEGYVMDQEPMMDTLWIGSEDDDTTTVWFTPVHTEYPDTIPTDVYEQEQEGRVVSFRPEVRFVGTYERDLEKAKEYITKMAELIIG